MPEVFWRYAKTITGSCEGTENDDMEMHQMQVLDETW